MSMQKIGKRYYENLRQQYLEEFEQRQSAVRGKGVDGGMDSRQVLASVPREAVKEEQP